MPARTDNGEKLRKEKKKRIEACNVNVIERRMAVVGLVGERVYMYIYMSMCVCANLDGIVPFPGACSDLERKQ